MSRTFCAQIQLKNSLIAPIVAHYTKLFLVLQQAEPLDGICEGQTAAQGTLGLLFAALPARGPLLHPHLRRRPAQGFGPNDDRGLIQ